MYLLLELVFALVEWRELHICEVIGRNVATLSISKLKVTKRLKHLKIIMIFVV